MLCPPRVERHRPETVSRRLDAGSRVSENAFKRIFGDRIRPIDPSVLHRPRFIAADPSTLGNCDTSAGHRAKFVSVVVLDARPLL